MRKQGKYYIILLLSFICCFSFGFYLFPYGVYAEEECPQCHEITLFTNDIAPSCTDVGYSDGECSNCGYMYHNEIPALGHAWNLVRSTATCTEAGAASYNCSRCGETRTDTVGALGHTWSLVSTTPATCTVSGSNNYSCSRCGAQTTEGIAALGHNYISKTVNEATCEGNGLKRYTCSRCGNSYDKIIEALGHDWGEEEEKEATCTEDGYKRKTCNRCEELDETIYPALGHDWGKFIVLKDATCTEDGSQEAECKRCGEKDSIAIPKLGHEYPEEWTVEKAPTYFAEGLRYKLCTRCGDRIEETIPKKDITPILIGGGGALIIAGGLSYFLRKRFRKKAADKLDRNWLKPNIETKTVLIVSEDEELIDCLKGKKHLEVKVSGPEDLIDSIVDNEPDLVLLDPCDEESLKKLPEIREEAAKAAAEKDKTEPETSEETGELRSEEAVEPVSCRFGLIIDEDLAEAETELIRSYKADKVITDHVKPGTNPNVVLTKLVLPAMEPKANSDDSLGNIGAVADLVGIPWISAIIDAYVAGRDVKAVMQSAAENQELGFSDMSTIISDIAGILGFDTVSSVAGLVSDVESIQAALDEEAGAYEKSEGKSAAKDIVEVVTDLMDK